MYFAFCEERSFSGSIESCFAPKNFGKTKVAKGSLREWCGNFLLVNFLKNLEERK